MLSPNPIITNRRAFDVALEFMRYSNDVLGAYLDALGGIAKIREELVLYQNAKVAELRISDPPNATEEFMDQQTMSHFMGPDAHGPQKLLHCSKQIDFKLRTASDGLDARLLGYMAITLLYSSWEDVFREKLATALGHPNKDDLKDDLFGDLRDLRHAIVHNSGVATERVESAKVLRWFHRGETIFISAEQVDRLWDRIDESITRLSGVQWHY